MKTGLVIEGGSLRSAFTCGVLKCFLESDLKLDTIFATDLGALAAVYYRSGQAEALEALYGDYFADKGEISYLYALKGERSAVDAQALADIVWKNHPLDM